MKHLTSFAVIFLLIFSFEAKTQDAPPKGFVTGSVTLTDNSEITGFLKNDIRSKASVVLIAATGGKKATYDGDKLSGVNIDGIKYTCIRGDFFKLICEGELCFLQKASDASSKPVYEESEAMFINGTEGKPGDYFIFNKAQQQLKLVNSQNVTEITAQLFANCEAAISKSKEAANDVAVLKDAVTIYNNRNK